ncbi:hypothetical protein [Levilactobacillus spicheri]|uniref:hypothetical protein n=1 Tax=Levilactobacillus spicheri TaxID=216463 RepID=UPI001649E034|nr:hypothetical protein [Levilactobacillus spicheri]
MRLALPGLAKIGLEQFQIGETNRSTPASKPAEVGTILKLRQKRGSPELGLDVTWQRTPGNINFTTASKSPLLR